MRRYWPTALALLAAAFSWYLVYTQLLVREMRRDARCTRASSSRLAGLNDPDADLIATAGLTATYRAARPHRRHRPGRLPASESTSLSKPIQSDPADQFRVLEYADQLAERNPPMWSPGSGPSTSAIRPRAAAARGSPGCRWARWSACWRRASVCATTCASERERIWAAMARESAHQMATPLSSLAGWVEILRLPDEEREEMASLPAVAAEMEADLDRLEKVSRRFEWIGRPVQTEAVDVRTLLRTLERYVRVRHAAAGAARWTCGGRGGGDSRRCWGTPFCWSGRWRT